MYNSLSSMRPLFNSKTLNASHSSSSRDQILPPLRISDILLAAEEDEDVLPDLFLMDHSEGSRSMYCPSPHRIVSRWISGLWRARTKRISAEHVKKEKEKEKLKESKMDGDEKGLADRAVQAICSMNVLNCANSVSATGESRKDISFNVGVGCCLLYLIAASKNELHKMMEMRLQMETLLQNTREDLLNTSSLSKLSKPSDRLAYSDADSAQDPQSETQFKPESSTISAVDQSFMCETPEKEECSEEGMNQLEAELQAELERLQLHLDGEKLLKHSEQQLIVEVTDEDSAWSKSQTTTSSGEVIDLQPQDADTDYGVPANELERRLHELLEERQQEDIRELEAAIECLKHKLYEKEVEVSWWKDTAMLISRHANEASI